MSIKINPIKITVKKQVYHTWDFELDNSSSEKSKPIKCVEVEGPAIRIQGFTPHLIEEDGTIKPISQNIWRVQFNEDTPKDKILLKVQSLYPSYLKEYITLVDE